MESKEKEKEKNKRKHGIGFWIECIILIVAVLVAGHSIGKILLIQNNYATARNTYEDIADKFVITTNQEQPESDTTVTESIMDSTSTEQPSKITPTPIKEKEKKKNLPKPPSFDIDWNGLRSVNSGIVGWLHIDALPQVHYPICQGTDNSFYLSHMFTGAVNGSGAIFMDCGNSRDFTDALTCIYGHRMDDGSMFGALSSMEDISLIQKTSPYFWIYTPDKIFCYQIFSIFEEPADSSMFAYYFDNDKAFREWTERVKAMSYIPFNVSVGKKDKVVMLATCTRDRVRRVVVLGKQVEHALSS